MWTTLIDQWTEYMRAAGNPESTINQRRYQLAQVARETASHPDLITSDELTQWLASKTWAPNTRKAFRSALLAFFKWANNTNRLTNSPAKALPPVRVPRGRPHPLPEPDYRAALEVADDRLDTAIQLGGACGLRRTEIASVHSDDLERDLTGWSLRVTGKGGHVRLVPVPDDLAVRIAGAHGWLFPSPQGGSHITPLWLGKIISNILPPGYSTHSLRHRCGTTTLAASGGNIRVVQELLGHASIETTAIYTAIDLTEMRQAVNAVQ